MPPRQCTTNDYAPSDGEPAGRSAYRANGASGPAPDLAGPILTRKEQEVLFLIGSKLDCKTIAVAMQISPFTVRKHRGNILRKLKLQTTAQLTAFALATGRSEILLPHDLTPRETEVVGFVAQGLTSKQIARHLHISPLTVRKHRENAMRNLGVHNMADLIAAVHALGFADTPSEAYNTI